MEIKINKEIRDYTENVYFGLSLRQFVCSCLACIVALIIYFSFKKYFNIDILSWLCILGALPFALMGFVKYNGLTAEEFLLAFIRSEILTPRHLCFNPKNLYYELIKNKESKGENNENIFKIIKKRKRRDNSS